MSIAYSYSASLHQMEPRDNYHSIQHTVLYPYPSISSNQPSTIIASRTGYRAAAIAITSVKSKSASRAIRIRAPSIVVRVRAQVHNLLYVL